MFTQGKDSGSHDDGSQLGCLDKKDIMMYIQLGPYSRIDSIHCKYSEHITNCAVAKRNSFWFVALTVFLVKSMCDGPNAKIINKVKSFLYVIPSRRKKQKSWRNKEMYVPVQCEG